MDGVINSLLLFSRPAEDKKKKVAQIPTTPYFWMDGGTVHQPRPSFTSARPMAALVWGKHPVPLTFLHRGGDKWGKEPIGPANGMTAAALLPATGAGGVLRRGQTADAPNQCESLAFNSGRCPLLTPSPQISLFGLAPTAVGVHFIPGKLRKRWKVRNLLSFIRHKRLVAYFLSGHERASGRRVLCASPRLACIGCLLAVTFAFLHTQKRAGETVLKHHLGVWF